MQKYLFGLVLIVSSCAFGQGVRYDGNNTTSAKNVPVGAQANVMTLPYSTVAVCGYPATPTSGTACTNLATIYSDEALTQQISNPIATDSQGRFGFWIAAGIYSESITTAGGTYVGTYALSLNSPPGPQGPGGIGCGAANCIIAAPTVTQTITQPAGTSLVVNSLKADTPLFNNIHYANAWCTTPGTLDDSCFNNAIADIVANGPVGAGGHRYGVIKVPPGNYVFANTVTIPAGVDIGIEGEYETSLWGAIITSSTNNQVLFLVTSDSVDIKNLSFQNGANSGVVGIQLGTATVSVFDSHINWNWFAGMEGAGIHIVNSSGDDLSHNTFDSNTIYGITSDFTAGDIQANYIRATDLRSFGQRYAVYLVGDSSNLATYSENTFSGLFTNSTATSAAVYLRYNSSSSITGTFSGSNNDDIDILNSTSISIGPFVSTNSGRAVVQVNGSTNINIFSGTITNTAIQSTPNTISAIVIADSIGTRISGVRSVTSTGGVANAQYGLSVNSGSTNTTVYGNSFNSQMAAPYSILDTTATIETKGFLSYDHAGSVGVATIAAGSGSGAVCVGTCTDTFGYVKLVNAVGAAGTVATITFASPYSQGGCVVGSAAGTFATFSIGTGTTSVPVGVSAATAANTVFSYLCGGK